MKRPFLIFLYFISILAVVRAQGPVTVEALRDLPRVSSPALSPDGNWLLFTVSRMLIEENRYVSKLMLLELENQRLTELTYNVHDVKWSPDGKFLSFLGEYGGVYGLYKAELKVRGRNARLESPLLLSPVRQSNHFLGHPTVKNYEWSPDGHWIAFVAADEATCQERADPNAPLVVDRTLYKSRTSFSDNCLTRVFLIDANGQQKRTLTPGPYDSHSITWSADSRYVAFLSNHSDEPDHNYNNDLWKVDISTGQLTRLTETTGTEHEPAWSPDGRWIAFPATIRQRNTKDSPPENTFIYGLSTDGRTRINLTADLDRRANSPQWHPSGQWLYFSIRDAGKYCIYRVQPGQVPEAVICREGAAGNFHIGQEKIVYIFSAPGQPGEVFIANADGSNAQQITFETSIWVNNHRLARVDSYWFHSFDGTPVQGFVAYPASRPAGKMPVVHTIHGGPHGMYGYAFSEFNELLAAKGYAVVFINPRGSTGYGQRFADGTYQAWGGGDYRDLMAGIDSALVRFPFLDGDRMVVTGGSYGGFMTNWVVTQTDRYKAAATVASVSNLISFYGTSLYQLLIETEFEGLPWDNYGLLWHFSPLAHVKNVKTPTLLLHGENDIDVPITQAEEFYIALRKLGVPTRFVRYPNEGHGVRQPQHREHYYQEIMEWFEKYVPAKP